MGVDVLRCAIIDIGSNTIHMCIYEYRLTASHFSRKIANRCEAVGLLNEISSEGLLTERGIERTTKALVHLCSVAESYHCKSVHCFATAVLRRIGNCDDVLTAIFERVKLNVDVLSGEEEAALSFSGLQFAFGQRLCSGIMMDLGGGSTEILRFEKAMPMQSVSLPFGSLSLYRDFVSGQMPTAREMAAIGNHVREALRPYMSWIGTHSVAYAMGGTAQTLYRLICSMTNAENGAGTDRFLRVQQLHTLYRMIEHSDDMLILLKNAAPDRLNTISPGVVAYYTIARMLGLRRIIVSNGGIREGYLRKYILLPALHPGGIQKEDSGESKKRVR